ncbi:uncharacterized protein F5147DRAFT_773763 [Suillus discolor]|uniref:Uncharacterized protein n=1 Tax=Suillus discolor TaxID=1912936 RepID=A0A9P7F810_9AGAM|nr:uncharacterized protein F5147DRAFT_773763 [Suillus discolor]KAG2108180.1 hypothetical protein F5147DRAFT_773763 [Suillus discolor]
MAILNSFVNNIFERIGTPSLCFFVVGLTLATVLRQVHPEKGISNEATAILNSIVNDIPQRLAILNSFVNNISARTAILNSFVNDIPEHAAILNSFVNDISERTAILNSFVNDIFERIGIPSFYLLSSLLSPASKAPVHPNTGMPWPSSTRLSMISERIDMSSLYFFVHPDTGISNKAMAILNSFVNDIFERIVLRQVHPDQMTAAVNATDED